MSKHQIKTLETTFPPRYILTDRKNATLLQPNYVVKKCVKMVTNKLLL